MSNPLADYLSAIEARDVREKAHEEYIDAYTKLANRTAAQARQPTQDEDSTTPTASTKTIRPATSKGKAPATSTATDTPSLTQLRSDLAATQRTRGELESQLASTTAELASLRATDALQKQRIAQLEKVRVNLERRGKDRVDELRGKGKFVEDIQDEMVALTLQLNMSEKEKEKLKSENEELTRRWVERMEVEVGRMNDQMGWEDQVGKGKGKSK